MEPITVVCKPVIYREQIYQWQVKKTVVRFCFFSERSQILDTLAFVRRNHKIVKAEGITACQSSYGENFYA